MSAISLSLTIFGIMLVVMALRVPIAIAMFVAATGVRQLLSDDQPQTRIAYPRDADDFRRCHAVYLEVPEVRNAIGIIAQLSIPWGEVVSAWTELARLLSDDPVAFGWRLAEICQAKHR